MADSNHMSIPDVRDRLRELAEETGIEELSVLASLTYRRRHKGRRAPVSSPTVTPQMRSDMRTYSRNNPNASNQEIANYFGVNPGRVSEAFERG